MRHHEAAVTKLLFLPGAGASAAFWGPVAERLPRDRPYHSFAWPGLGRERHDPAIRGIDDLVGLVLDRIETDADLVAQSMGGYIAIRVALEAPGKVRRLVLTATSGGVPVAALGGGDWRAAYRRDFPDAAAWITQDFVPEDFSARLGTVTARTLLLWGDADPISPPAVGHRLAELLPAARLHIVRGGGHDLAQTHAAEIAPLIADHLR